MKGEFFSQFWTALRVSQVTQIETLNSLKHCLKMSCLVSNLRVLPNIEVSSMSISQSIEVLDEYMYIVLSEVLVCSITKYFYKLCYIWMSLQCQSKCKQQVQLQALLHTKTCNKLFIVNCFILCAFLIRQEKGS